MLEEDLDQIYAFSFTSLFPEDYAYQILNPGMFSITLNPEETIEGELIFMPTEVFNLTHSHTMTPFDALGKQAF